MNKKFSVTYFNHVVKGSVKMNVYAETKAKAKKKFKDMWHVPYQVLGIVEIKEGE